MKTNFLIPLTAKDCEIKIIAEQEYAQIEGNASAIDDETDTRIIDEICYELERGNIWAWCSVEVKVSWHNFSASDYLGCCSYENEQDFRNSGYFLDMVDTCLENLNAQREKCYIELREDQVKWRLKSISGGYKWVINSKDI